MTLFSLLFGVALAAFDPKPGCESKLLYVPAVTSDNKASDALVDLAAQRVARHFAAPCLTSARVEPGEERIWADHHGFNAHWGKRPQRLSRRQLKSIVKQTRATHLVFTTWTPQQRKVAIAVYRVNERFDLEPAGRWEEGVPASVAAVRATPLVRYMALLAPNTATLGFVSTEVNGFQTGKELEGYESVSTEQKSRLPQYLSAMGLDKIDHAAAFRLWDAAASVFPSGYLFGIDQETTFAKVDPLTREADMTKTRKAHIKIYGTCANLNVMASLHSPVGTTYAGLGGGPCFYQRKQESEKAELVAAGAVRFIFGHRVFLSWRSYLYFDVDGLSFSQRLYNDGVVKSSSLGRTTFGYGYYLPDAEHRVTELFD